jgi:N-acetylglucosaminyldiphosphoundecaprenol N-acetyl-beta-D-mannosaminyltransferase
LRHRPEAGSTPSEGQRVTLCGVAIDAIDFPTAVATVLDWTADGAGGCRVVVTPNVHHLVLLHEQPALRRAYRRADLVLADGAPLVALSRRIGRPLPERVAGSDLVPALLEAAPPGLRVFLLGAGPGVGERAVEAIGRTWPDVEVVGQVSPAPGFEHDAATNDALVKEINEARTQLLVVGLGAPKQELWAHEQRDRLDAAAVLCVGATIDFLAGQVSRAPGWMQRAGLEWLYRIRLEPRRLLGRYAHDGRVFAGLALAELRGRSPQLPTAESAADDPGADPN